MYSSDCAGAVPPAIGRWLSGPGRNSKKGQHHPAQRWGLRLRARASFALFWDYLQDFSNGRLVSYRNICPMSGADVALNSYSFCGLIIITYPAKTHFLVPAIPEVWGRSRTGPVWLIFTCMQAATAGLYRCLPKSCSLPSRKKRSLKQQHWERCDICDKLCRSYIYSAFLINLSPRTLVRIHCHASN